MPSKADHKPTGELCTLCGLPSSRHRANRERKEYHRAYRKTHPSPIPRERIIGIDGEGQGRKPHLYNYLCAADEFGKVWDLGSDPKKRLSTEECLEFLLELPVKSLVFGYAFMYDLTKILTDLPDNLLYLLFHEERRALIVDGMKGKEVRYRPIRWGNYRLNFQHRRFSVKRMNGNDFRVVWDVFAFFQSKFTKACIDWKVGSEAQITAMERMKERRSSFDAQSFPEVQAYCKTECKFLANLGRQLLDAHDDAGYHLTSYFGAGSTASSLMKKYGVREYIGEIPDAMKEGVACAFFGGRFENSVIGPIRRPVWNADINSAYPYAATFLPCLIHGRWRFLKTKLDREIERSRLALVNWSLPRLPNYHNSDTSAWGPLPVRKVTGSIAFPLGASSGWTWKEEFLAARALRPDVIATGAWLYDSACACQPFSFLPEVYLERLRLGGETRGIPLKLGPNSVYGKLVQSVGIEPPFQCWVWGGCITSSCRAQLLDAIRLSDRPASVLMLATDGVWSDAPIDLPPPRDTGTSAALEITKGKKGPLGAWDVKLYPQGVFAARPGIYFPLDPTEKDLEKVRARGLGRRVLYEQYRIVEDAYRYDMDSVIVGCARSDVQTRETFGATQRFVGARTAMSFTPKEGVKRSKDYGEWIDWPTEVSFDPRPKREHVRADGTLSCWDYFEAPSLPYEKALKDPEGALLELAALIAEEQPNAEFSDFEIGEGL